MCFHLAHEALHKMADGHTRRDSVGVDDEVWHDALEGPRHVLLVVRDADCALLPVARGKLVADLRDTGAADADLDELLPALARGDEYLVHDAVLVGLEGVGAVALAELAGARGVLREQRSLADHDVVARDAGPGRHDAVLVELVVGPALHALAPLAARLLDLLPLAVVAALLLLLVALERDGTEEPAVDGALVHHDRVLLVEAGVAADRHDGVVPCGELREVEVLHRPRGHQGLLRVVEHVSLRVHAVLVVGRVDAHGLLAHGALVRVTGTLVVVREGDDRGADAQDHAGVDLAVRVGLGVGVARAAKEGVRQRNVNDQQQLQEARQTGTRKEGRGSRRTWHAQQRRLRPSWRSWWSLPPRCQRTRCIRSTRGQATGSGPAAARRCASS